MILKIVMYGDPVLRAVGAKVGEVTEAIRTLARDMLETMVHADGVGLAAQQVGVALRLAVIDVSQSEERPSAMWVGGEPVDLSAYMPMVLLNPELELGAEKESGTEGCLSFPRIHAEIVRSQKVRCRAMRLDGSALEFEASGLLARALQHEVDHLQGVLFIDRMGAATKAALSGKLKRLRRAGS
ncbi:MAG: peptide deformylase [Verrucomicrobiota bacterium]|jgi:peptide deformylase